MPWRPTTTRRHTARSPCTSTRSAGWEPRRIGSTRSRRKTDVVSARFDDLIAGEALAFGPPKRVLSTRSPGEMAALLAQVERATAGGDWAYGYVAYEQERDGPPLAWFGLADPPEPVAPVTPPPSGAGGRTRWVPGWSAEEH